LTVYVRRPDVDRLKRSNYIAVYTIKIFVLDVYLLMFLYNPHMLMSISGKYTP